MSMDQRNLETVDKQLKHIEEEQTLSEMRNKIMQQVIDEEFITQKSESEHGEFKFLNQLVNQKGKQLPVNFKITKAINNQK